MTKYKSPPMIQCLSCKAFNIDSPNDTFNKCWKCENELPKKEGAHGGGKTSTRGKA